MPQQLHIVACSVEPEFVKMTEITPGTGAYDLTIEIARICVNGQPVSAGSIQIHLLPSDVATIKEAIL